MMKSFVLLSLISRVAKMPTTSIRQAHTYISASALAIASYRGASFLAVLISHTKAAPIDGSKMLSKNFQSMGDSFLKGWLRRNTHSKRPESSAISMQRTAAPRGLMQFFGYSQLVENGQYGSLAGIPQHVAGNQPSCLQAIAHAMRVFGLGQQAEQLRFEFHHFSYRSLIVRGQVRCVDCGNCVQKSVGA